MTFEYFIYLVIASAIGGFVASTPDLNGVRRGWIYRIMVFTSVARAVMFIAETFK